MNDIINKLNISINNDDNNELLKLNTEIIKKDKYNILKKINLTRDEIILYLNKLEEYRYIDEYYELKYGTYIRFIKLTNKENIKLYNGGIICDIKIVNDGIVIKCKNFMNKFFVIKMHENLIFQKITQEEKLIFMLLDYIK
jgi:hypothetical protein